MAGVIGEDRIRHTPKDEKVRLVDIIYSSKPPTAPFITVDLLLPESNGIKSEEKVAGFFM